MSNNTLKSRVKIRIDTASNWTSANPVLASGELGISKLASGEVMVKCGDGTSTWANLPFITAVPNAHSTSDNSLGAASTTMYGHAKSATEDPLPLGDDADVGELSDVSVFARASHVHPAVELTLTGDVTIPATILSGESKSIATTLANSGVTAGTYKSVTVDAKGRVTNGTNPTTLSGYGITDAAIANDVITLGNSTITPVKTSGDQTIAGTKTFSSTITGSISGNSGTATKLSNARTIQTDLASTSSASFDGSDNVTPGVTGTLPVANGGTGATSLSDITVGKAVKLSTGYGSATQPIYIASDGTVTATTYSLGTSVPANAVFTVMTGATSSADGVTGLVPQPQKADRVKYLCGNGTWSTPGDSKVNVTLGTTTKAYLLGTTTEPTSTSTGTQAIADTGVYLDTESGKLVATTFKGTLIGNCSGSSESCNGAAASATKAEQDASGNVITTTYATISYVDTAVSGLVSSAPETLDTLNELAAALGDDPNFATTVATNIGAKQDKLGTTNVTTSGTGNAVTSVTASNGTVTVTKGTTFLTSHQDISGKQNAATAVTHTESTAVGSATQPVYIASDGKATATTYSLNKTVPADAVFTDTDTITTIASTTGSGNAVTAISASNGALTVTKGTTFLTSHQDISGKQDASTAVTHTASTAVGSATQPVYIASDGTATATTYTLGSSVPSASASDAAKYLRGDGTWASPLTEKTVNIKDLKISDAIKILA